MVEAVTFLLILVWGQTPQKSRIIILGTGFNPTLSSLILASHCNLTFIIIDRWFLVTYYALHYYLEIKKNVRENVGIFFTHMRRF